MVDPLRDLPGARVKPADVSAREMRPARAPQRDEGVRSFQETLAETVSEVQRLQTEADTTIKKVVAGEITDVSEAMVQIQKADVAFRTMMTVRNKVMDAYQEIMRMQI